MPVGTSDVAVAVADTSSYAGFSQPQPPQQPPPPPPPPPRRTRARSVERAEQPPVADDAAEVARHATKIERIRTMMAEGLSDAAVEGWLIMHNVRPSLVARLIRIARGVDPRGTPTDNLTDSERREFDTAVITARRMIHMGLNAAAITSWCARSGVSPNVRAALMATLQFDEASGSGGGSAASVAPASPAPPAAAAAFNMDDVPSDRHEEYRMVKQRVQQVLRMPGQTQRGIQDMLVRQMVTPSVRAAIIRNVVIPILGTSSGPTETAAAAPAAPGAMDSTESARISARNYVAAGMPKRVVVPLIVRNNVTTEVAEQLYDAVLQEWAENQVRAHIRARLPRRAMMRTLQNHHVTQDAANRIIDEALAGAAPTGAEYDAEGPAEDPDDLRSLPSVSIQAAQEITAAQQREFSGLLPHVQAYIHRGESFESIKAWLLRKNVSPSVRERLLAAVRTSSSAAPSVPTNSTLTSQEPMIQKMRVMLRQGVSVDSVRNWGIRQRLAPDLVAKLMQQAMLTAEVTAAPAPAPAPAAVAAPAPPAAMPTDETGLSSEEQRQFRATLPAADRLARYGLSEEAFRGWCVTNHISEAVYERLAARRAANQSGAVPAAASAAVAAVPTVAASAPAVSFVDSEGKDVSLHEDYRQAVRVAVNMANSGLSVDAFTGWCTLHHINERVRQQIAARFSDLATHSRPAQAASPPVSVSDLSTDEREAYHHGCHVAVVMARSGLAVGTFAGWCTLQNLTDRVRSLLIAHFNEVATQQASQAPAAVSPASAAAAAAAAAPGSAADLSPLEQDAYRRGHRVALNMARSGLPVDALDGWCTMQTISDPVRRLLIARFNEAVAQQAMPAASSAAAAAAASAAAASAAAAAAPPPPPAQQITDLSPAEQHEYRHGLLAAVRMAKSQHSAESFAGWCAVNISSHRVRRLLNSRFHEAAANLASFPGQIDAIVAAAAPASSRARAAPGPPPPPVRVAATGAAAPAPTDSLTAARQRRYEEAHKVAQRMARSTLPVAAFEGWCTMSGVEASIRDMLVAQYDTLAAIPSYRAPAEALPSEAPQDLVTCIVNFLRFSVSSSFIVEYLQARRVPFDDATNACLHILRNRLDVAPQNEIRPLQNAVTAILHGLADEGATASQLLAACRRQGASLSEADMLVADAARQLNQESITHPVMRKASYRVCAIAILLASDRWIATDVTNFLQTADVDQECMAHLHRLWSSGVPSYHAMPAPATESAAPVPDAVHAEVLQYIAQGADYTALLTKLQSRGYNRTAAVAMLSSLAATGVAVPQAQAAAPLRSSSILSGLPSALVDYAASFVRHDGAVASAPAPAAAPAPQYVLQVALQLMQLGINVQHVRDYIASKGFDASQIRRTRELDDIAMPHADRATRVLQALQNNSDLTIVCSDCNNDLIERVLQIVSKLDACEPQAEAEQESNTDTLGVCIQQLVGCASADEILARLEAVQTAVARARAQGVPSSVMQPYKVSFITTCQTLVSQPIWGSVHATTVGTILKSFAATA